MRVQRCSTPQTAQAHGFRHAAAADLSPALLALLALATQEKKKKEEDDDPFGDKEELEAQRKAISIEVKAACDKSAAGEVDGAITALKATSDKHKLEPNDLFGFIFEVALDEEAIKQVKVHQPQNGC